MDSEDENHSGEIYYFPISVGNYSYKVSVLSNYSSVPKISYCENGNSVYVDFRGDPETPFLT